MIALIISGLIAFGDGKTHNVTLRVEKFVTQEECTTAASQISKFITDSGVVVIKKTRCGQ